MPTNNNRRTSAKRIAIFNHKGGVGKTTLTFNIAAAIASRNKKVLLVDSDPQCNLTASLIEEEVVNDLLDNSDSAEGGTLWSALKPVAEATGEVKAIPALERLPNVFLLPGDIRISEYEQELNVLWNDCFQMKPKGFRGTTSLSYVVNLAAQQIEADFVFYDSGPNIGPLNRIILLDCDYFIVPAACDLFSIRAFKTLGYTLEKWITGWRNISQLAPRDLYLLPGLPKFLGYIPQRFRVYGGLPSSDFAKYLPRMERQIMSDVAARLREIDPSLASDSLSLNQLGQVKDFTGLATASQSQGKPIKDVRAGTPTQRQEAGEEFLEIADRIIERTTGA